VIATEAVARRLRLSVPPWNFAGAEYERARQDAVLAALERRGYERAFEPGCSTGLLTLRLARICGHVTATEVAGPVVACARQRCAHLSNVEIRHADLVSERVEGPFDLIVLCEIGYFSSTPELLRLAAALMRSLAQGGELIVGHWLGAGSDQRWHAEAVHAMLAANLPMRRRRRESCPRFRVDSWLRI
jgi:protein-L-isoaspartate O-methyltransferase